MPQESIPDFLTGLLSTPTRLLKAPTEIKHLFQHAPNFVTLLFEFLTLDGQPKAQLDRFHLLTIIHSPLVEVFENLPEKCKDEIREGLLNTVVAQQNSLKCVGAVALIVRELVEIETLQTWMEALGELVKWMVSEEKTVTEAVIQFFVFLLRETPYTRSNNELGLQRLASALLENLFPLFAQTDVSEQAREKLLYLVLQVLKTFSVLDGTDDVTVKQCFDSTYDLWISLFVSAIQSSLTSHLNLKKYILKIVIVIFRDMQKYVSARPFPSTQLYTLWEFSYKLIPLYLWTIAWERPLQAFPVTQNAQKIDLKESCYDDDFDALLEPVEAVTHAAIQFLSVLTSMPQLSNTIKISLQSLTNALFHFMLMTEFQFSTWRTNPFHFQNQNAMDYDVSVRVKALGVLNELIEKTGDYAIESILLVSEKFLLNLPEETTTQTLMGHLKNYVDLARLPEITHNLYPNEAKITQLVRLSSCDVKALGLEGESMRKMDVALTVLSRFAEDIIVFQSKQPNSFDIQSFVGGLLKQISNPHYYPLLKGQSLHCLTRFTEIISIKYRQLFPDLVIASAYCLQESMPLSLRLVAARGITIFLRKIEKHKIVFSEDQETQFKKFDPIGSLVSLPLTGEYINNILDTFLEIARTSVSTTHSPPADYLLALFHRCLKQNSSVQIFFNLIEAIIMDGDSFRRIVPYFIAFATESLRAYDAALRRKKQDEMKDVNNQLLLSVFRLMNALAERALLEECPPEQKALLSLLEVICSILELNEEVQTHLAATLYLKTILKACWPILAQDQHSCQALMRVIRSLLSIPKNKAFESASLYAGNLIILAFDRLKKQNYQILQEVVLKIFKSRTPSVIQSLVLVYARLMNMKTSQEALFDLLGESGETVKGIIDFLSSFSIENRMGLKILVDKWLLQQSLFRGKNTKIATFMALSKLFLLRDKRVDNLLVIGFNPSHTQLNNDVTAPLKILATLIRCLDNEAGGGKADQDEEEEQQEFKDPATLDVALQKFKEDKSQEEAMGGGLAERENQQGSTCYMSAMLQFYDDGEECDEKTQDDLHFLQDCSVRFDLKEYLTQFFQYLAREKGEYLRDCLRGLLKEDVRTLQKYVKLP